MFRVDPQADGNTTLLPQRAKTLQLAEGVEYQVVGDAQQLNDVALLEGGGKAVYLTTEFLAPQTRFPG